MDGEFKRWLGAAIWLWLRLIGLLKHPWSKLLFLAVSEWALFVLLSRLCWAYEGGVWAGVADLFFLLQPMVAFYFFAWAFQGFQPANETSVRWPRSLLSGLLAASLLAVFATATFILIAVVATQYVGW